MQRARVWVVVGLATLLLVGGCGAGRDPLSVSLRESSSAARSAGVALGQHGAGKTTSSVRDTVLDDALTTVTSAGAAVASGSDREVVRAAAGVELTELATLLRRLSATPTAPGARAELDAVADRIDHLVRRVEVR